MPTSISAGVWLITISVLVLLIMGDLAIVSRRTEIMKRTTAVGWVIFYISLAVIFAIILLITGGSSLAGQFAAGYVTEYCLSVDNLFAFMIIMSRFSVPAAVSNKALYAGIIVSLLLRVPLIAAGAVAISAFSWMLYIFGGILVYTSIRFAVSQGADNPAFLDGRILRVVRRVLPIWPEYVGRRIMVVIDGHRMLTSLAMVIAAIGIANVIFAVDSIPAIFGLTRDAYIVLTANVFALLGLRQLYTLVVDLLERLRYLNIGLVVILLFIGLKMIATALTDSGVRNVGPVPVPVIGIYPSLLVIAAILSLVTVASFVHSHGVGGHDKPGHGQP